MTTYDEAVGEAREIGRAHGENAAAEWVYESSGWDRRIALAKMDSVHPFEDQTIADVTGLPAPDLSGEWADGYTPMLLASDCGIRIGVDPYGMWVDDLCDAYESAFSDAVETAVREACERLL